MKITITIDTDRVDSLSTEQCSLIKDELALIADRCARPNFYAELVKRLGKEYGSPLKGEVGFPNYDVLIRHTIETGNTYYETLPEIPA